MERTYILCIIPGLNLSQEIIGPGRQLELEIQSEGSVDVLHEVEQGGNFFLDLTWHAEYMSIVLSESADTGQARQCTRGFIPMDDAEFCHSDGKLSVASIS
jgi:hypothetical protein